MNRAIHSTVVLLLVLAFRSMGAEIPFLHGRVNDVAGMLSDAAVTELERILKQHEDSTTNQVVVLTIPSLEGEPLEEYSIRVAETWKIGTAENDNGVILLIVRDERMVRIEVGSGLEGSLTDAACGLIIRREIVPRFREGDYDGGIRGGVEAILASIAGEYKADEESAEEEDFIGRLVGFLLFLFVVGLFSLMALFSTGWGSWLLFAFLTPFWLVFPGGLLGWSVGIPVSVLYFVVFLVLKLWLTMSGKARMLSRRWPSLGGLSGLSTGGWSSRSGSFSGSGGSFGGGGFSGGGGGFSGGGASGRW
jgi:uncharacterized protein